jgi:hypothetical protein
MAGIELVGVLDDVLVDDEVDGSLGDDAVGDGPSEVGVCVLTPLLPPQAVRSTAARSTGSRGTPTRASAECLDAMQPP